MNRPLIWIGVSLVAIGWFLYAVWPTPYYQRMLDGNLVSINRFTNAVKLVPGYKRDWLTIELPQLGTPIHTAETKTVDEGVPDLTRLISGQTANPSLNPDYSKKVVEVSLSTCWCSGNSPRFKHLHDSEKLQITDGDDVSFPASCEDNRSPYIHYEFSIYPVSQRLLDAIKGASKVPLSKRNPNPFDLLSNRKNSLTDESVGTSKRNPNPFDLLSGAAPPPAEKSKTHFVVTLLDGSGAPVLKTIVPLSEIDDSFTYSSDTEPYSEEQYEKIKSWNVKWDFSQEPVSQVTDNLAGYYRAYRDPFVFVRAALNGYLNGGKGWTTAPELLMGCDKDKDGLGCFSKDYYRSKFIVLTANSSIMGGENIDILFVDKPDKVFTAWVYKLAGGQYDFRGFWQNPDWTADMIGRATKIYPKLLEDKEHSL